MMNSFQCQVNRRVLQRMISWTLTACLPTQTLSINRNRQAQMLILVWRSLLHPIHHHPQPLGWNADGGEEKEGFYNRPQLMMSAVEGCLEMA